MVRQLRALLQSEEATIGLVLLFGLVAASVQSTVGDWSWGAQVALTLGIWLGLIMVAQWTWRWYRRSQPRP